MSCGQTFGDTQIKIVDPQTTRPAIDLEIGEIWVKGGSIAGGYWRNPVASESTFNAVVNGDAGWLRTGDLGFVAEGELFITGRLREMIIIAGRNVFPVDIERTVESADPAVVTGGVVAFSIDVDGAERLVVAAELRREWVRGWGAGIICPSCAMFVQR